jgi:hypothetical protein
MSNSSIEEHNSENGDGWQGVLVLVVTPVLNHYGDTALSTILR